MVVAMLLFRRPRFLILLLMLATSGCAQDDILTDPISGYTLQLPFAKTTRVGKGVSTERSLIENWSDPASGVMVKFMVMQNDTSGLTEEGVLGAAGQTAAQDLGFRQIEFAITDQQRQRVGSVRLLTSDTGAVATIIKISPKGMITINLSGQKIESVKQTLTWIYANNK